MTEVFTNCYSRSNWLLSIVLRRLTSFSNCESDVSDSIDPPAGRKRSRFLGGYHVVPCTLPFICNIDTLTTQCDLCVWAYFDVNLWWDHFFLFTPGELLFRGHCFLDSLSIDQENWRDMVPGENGRSSHRNHNHRPTNKCSERILNDRLYWNVSWWRTHVLSTRRLVFCFVFLVTGWLYVSE